MKTEPPESSNVGYSVVNHREKRVKVEESQNAAAAVNAPTAPVIDGHPSTFVNISSLSPGNGPPMVQPLKTVEALLAWRPVATEQHGKAALKLMGQLKNGPRLMAVHDMKGNYQEDRWLQGDSNGNAFTLGSAWSLLDIFAYFSHSLVSIPPPCWSNAAHANNVAVLGTFITEHEAGEQMCRLMFASEAMATLIAQQLAQIAHTFGFEGWIINIENAVPRDLVPNIYFFLRKLTALMRAGNTCSQVIWYDAVTTEGKLEWQNTLNRNNFEYWRHCDGIYINYQWTEATLAALAELVDRSSVYMGIDCFGRGTYGGGGLNCNLALEAIKKVGMSAALFAIGWPHETVADSDVQKARTAMFWSRINSAWYERTVDAMKGISIPLATVFSTGRGRRLSAQGEVVSNQSWYNINMQMMPLPVVHYRHLLEDKLYTKPEITEDVAYFGGSSLKILGRCRGCSIMDLFGDAIDGGQGTPLPRELGARIVLACSKNVEVSLHIVLKHAAPPGSSRNYITADIRLPCIPGGHRVETLQAHAQYMLKNPELCAPQSSASLRATLSYPDEMLVDMNFETPRYYVTPNRQADSLYATTLHVEARNKVSHPFDPQSSSPADEDSDLDLDEALIHAGLRWQEYYFQVEPKMISALNCQVGIEGTNTAPWHICSVQLQIREKEGQSMPYGVPYICYVGGLSLYDSALPHRHRQVVDLTAGEASLKLQIDGNREILTFSCVLKWTNAGNPTHFSVSYRILENPAIRPLPWMEYAILPWNECTCLVNNIKIPSWAGFDVDSAVVELRVRCIQLEALGFAVFEDIQTRDVALRDLLPQLRQ